MAVTLLLGILDPRMISGDRVTLIFTLIFGIFVSMILAVRYHRVLLIFSVRFTAFALLWNSLNNPLLLKFAKLMLTIKELMRAHDYPNNWK
jgi:hypothetical protein